MAKNYVKVEREPRIGDYILYEKALLTRLTPGKHYKVVDIDEYGDAFVMDDLGDYYDTGGTDFEIFEEVELKVGDFVKVLNGNSYSEKGDILKVVAVDRSIFPYKVEHLDGTYAGWYSDNIVTKATENEVFAQFKIGDRVRLLSGGGDAPLCGYRNGEVYTNNNCWPDAAPNDGLIELVGGDVPHGYAKPSQLQKVSDETKRLQVGDYAKLKNTVGNVAGFRAEDIVELRYNEVGASDFKVKLLAGPLYGYTNEENLLPVSAEEVEEAKRWAAVSRRPNEYKKGDIVRVIESPNALPVGTIFEVKAIGNDYVRDYRGNVYVIRRKRVELVAPVEQRVDIDKEGSDE
ncbi:hypothetical protein [Bacillus chungangensis]|uniref:Transcription antitermination factor NusG n=1 Tax=Bacillus chungangensis TaxID=587633 RepID=A0ABT9WNS4_9BACI|nr:hypothetical protein [Bacillus chungangensis]MDQ0174435.1 transcription antitermination factor NusG [Bacillus chungangensis]